MKQFRLWAFLFLFMFTLLTVGESKARAQAESDTGPVAGSHELQVWASGGHNVKGGATGITAWNAGARYGWVITDLHGPGPLSGRFEYAVDAIPVFVVAEQTQTSYGVSFDPFALRWNFKQRQRIMPYLEISGGALFTSHAIPVGANAVNFTPSLGLGISVPRGKYRWTAEVHYLHISDAALTNYNPGINVLQVRVGFGLFTKRAE